MLIIFVLSTLTGALMTGLAELDVSLASSFAGILAIAGLTRITWREQFQMLTWCRSTATGETTSQPCPDYGCPLGAVGSRLMDWSLEVWPRRDRSALREFCRVVYQTLNSNQGIYDDEAHYCDGSSCALPSGMRWRRGQYFGWRREHECQF
jgi:hypothetical protein